MDDQKAEQAKKLIEQVRPALQRDGGDIEFISLEEDMTIKVRLLGACHGCPYSQMTLSQGVFRFVKDKMPEIKAVVPVN